MMDPRITPELLAKYSRPAPRYTSYPTAPHFHPGFDAEHWQAELARDSTRDWSVYVHIPFCDTLCWYCGCNMVASRNYQRASAYLDTLERELDLARTAIGRQRPMRQLHWGGGTPTFLNPEDIRRLAAMIESRMPRAHEVEASCEIDPRELTPEHVAALAEAGFNRVSMGVQDLTDAVQQAVHRIQPAALVDKVYGWLRDAGFASINLDLMVGLPRQQVDSFAATLDHVIELAPDRLAVFNYAHVPWMKPHQKLIREDELPDPAGRWALQMLAMERLTAAGYVYIGMDHYARPEDEIVQAQKNAGLYRNFQGYTTHPDCDILGLGASSISQTESTYAQNQKDIKTWQAAIDAGRLPVERGIRLSDDDRLRRDAITRIMCDLVLDRDAFGARWNIDFDRYFADALPELEALATDGLIQLEGSQIRVTDTGRILLRNVAVPFDAWYRREATSNDGPRYSRTL